MLKFDSAPMERDKSGDLRRMDSDEFKSAIRLIKKLCANCSNGNCFLLERDEPVSCPQIISQSVCCKYFRYVLLNDPEAKELKARLLKTAEPKHCKLCGMPFTAAARQTKYCEKCKRVAARNRREKYRKKSGSYVDDFP